jgi:ATP-binding cassette subfamily B protein RaxB
MMFGPTLPVILQREAAECGLACLAMVLNYHGRKTSLFDLRTESISRGINLKDLMRACERHQLNTRAIRISLDELPLLKMPTILHWGLDHFVVLKKVVRGQYHVHDPASGLHIYDRQQISSLFTGVALELTPSADFQPEKSNPQFNWRSMFGQLSNIRSAVAKIIILAITLELLLLLTPFYMQSVVDFVLLEHDTDLLMVLALGFMFLVAMQAAASLARSWTAEVFIWKLGFIWEQRLLQKLLRLPTRFFELRSLGEIFSYFHSIRHIKTIIGGSFINAIMDGLMSLIVLLVMFNYSPTLLLVSLLFLLIYTLLRLALYRKTARAVNNTYISQARQHSHAIESIRGIQTLKLFATEQDRLNTWESLQTDHINDNLKLSWLQTNFRISNTFLSGAERVLVIYLGAQLVMESRFTLGMLMAYLAYRDLLVNRANLLIDRILDFKLLRVHAERLVDVTNSAAEDNRGRRLDQPIESIELNKLSFRYASNEPPAVAELTMQFDRSQSVAIVGPSGCGKTTLMKLMTGLLEPDSGEVLINGLNLQQLDLTDYRNRLGVVMQDDALFAGSIAQNITMFTTEVDPERISQAARQAQVFDEIMAMPMGFDTLVGDMGSSFSGGQKQRILLARALYKQPDFLLLDEATSHLDPANESKINQLIKQLDIPCITIAHRRETIASADLVWVMNQGQLITQCSPREYLSKQPKIEDQTQPDQ